MSDRGGGVGERRAFGGVGLVWFLVGVIELVPPFALNSEILKLSSLKNFEIIGRIDYLSVGPVVMWLVWTLVLNCVLLMV